MIRLIFARFTPDFLKSLARSLHKHFKNPTLTAMSHDVKPSVSNRMRRTKGRNNPFEQAVRSLLFSHGLRYRVHFPVPGMAKRSCDLAFPKKRIAIFLDGCFWHGCVMHSRKSKSNKSFWDAKILKNQQRDEETSDHLRKAGWTVLRYWEHQEIKFIVDAIRSAAGDVSHEQECID